MKVENTVYGYVRVSTKDQNEDRQLIALAEFPVLKRNIYMDKLSGKDRELFWKDYKKRGIEYVIKLYGEKTAEARIRRKVKMMFAKIFGESELHSNNQMV